MAEATNAQMQAFADQRLRPRAEQFRALYLACLDDKAVIDDVYERAAGSNRWDDGRTDGPPHLLKAGNAASPDDVLNFNSFITRFIHLMEGTFPDLGTANGADEEWAVLQDACVRPVQL